MRLLPLLATATLTASLTVAASPVSAAAATCRGVPTTIAASGVPRVDGTEGNDVIVAVDVPSVNGLGGDDLICVTSSGFTLVDAGAGNDVVDATGTIAGMITAYRGDGDDTYLGSASVDSVHAGTTDRTDSGHDVIDTGPPGPKPDYVMSGQGVEPNPDRITGGRMTLTWAGTPTSTSSADVGRGSIFATEDRGQRRVTIDNRAGTLTTSSSGPALRLRGITSFTIRAFRELERFTFRGSNRDESLNLSDARKADVRIGMGGGADDVLVGTYATGSSFGGGQGRDFLDVQASTRIDLDLRRGTLTTRNSAHRATGFEDAYVRADRARLIGTNGPNTLSVDACRATVEGLGGRDTLTAFNSTGYGQAGKRCRGRSTLTMTLLGGPGSDTLTGSTARDLLVGGPGRDKADGRQGSDTCQAEIRTSCEVRR